MSVEDWIEFGYVELLKNHFFIILVDPFECQAGGCGETPDLTLDDASLYIHNLLTGFDIDKAVIWGYSLGAKVALSFYGCFPSLVQGLVLGGFELNTRVDLKNDLVINTLKQGGRAWVDLWERMFCVPPEMAVRLYNSDMDALIELRKAEAVWPDLTPAAQRCTVKTLVYAGEHCFYRKETEQACHTFTKGVFYEIPGLNHFELMAAPELLSGRVISQYAQT